MSSEISILPIYKEAGTEDLESQIGEISDRVVIGQKNQLQGFEEIATLLEKTGKKEELANSLEVSRRYLSGIVREGMPANYSANLEVWMAEEELKQMDELLDEAGTDLPEVRRDIRRYDNPSELSYYGSLPEIGYSYEIRKVREKPSEEVPLKNSFEVEGKIPESHRLYEAALDQAGQVYLFEF